MSRRARISLQVTDQHPLPTLDNRPKETTPLQHFLKTLARFFAHESCGKCYPCQMGTQRQYEILQRLSAGTFLPGDLARLEDVGWTMTDASLCGLGQTAASAVLSAMRNWPELFAPDTGTHLQKAGHAHG